MTNEKMASGHPPSKLALFVFAALIMLLLMSWAELFHPRDVRDMINEQKELFNSMLSLTSKCNVQEDNGPVRYVYIDVGGNTGQTIQEFSGSGDIFSRTFKDKHMPENGAVPPILDPSRYEMFVFEPNNDFLPDYQQLRKEGYNFTLLEAAAGDKDGFINFDGGWEGGAISESGITKERQSDSDVPAMDFSAWLKRSFRDRDYLLCKIDIEGAETRVLTKMIQDGMICFCDRLSVEWHMHVRIPGQPLWFTFNYLDEVRSHPNPLGHSNASCHIPHLQRSLDIVECMLPKVVMSIRDSCPNADPLEKWF